MNPVETSANMQVMLASNRPATFIIDRRGTIRYAKRATSFGDRPTADEILTELKKLDAENWPGMIHRVSLALCAGL